MAATERDLTTDTTCGLTPADEQLVRERLLQAASTSAVAPTQPNLRRRLERSCRGALGARLERTQR